MMPGVAKAQFIEKAINTHGDSYDYSKVKYSTNRVPVEIICKIHGLFKQRPGDHTRGQGCPKCGLDKISKALKHSKETFFKKAFKRHGNLYNYDNSIYIADNEKITIECSIHGNFSQVVSSHLQGSGCPKCAIEKRANNCRTSLEDFISKANKVHNNKYDYTYSEYINNSTNIVISCPLHGDFNQLPAHHLRGSGCSTCSFTGFDKNAPAILYYFKIKNVWKIGITNRTVEERHKQDMENISNIMTWRFDKGSDAMKYEKDILEKNKEYAYVGPTPFIGNTGITECFAIDIYKLHMRNDNE